MKSSLNFFHGFLLFSLLAFFILPYFFWSFFVHDYQLCSFSLKKGFFHSAEQNLTLEIAKSTAVQEKGMSSRLTFEDNFGKEIDGMLFIFPGKRNASFWMKDTKIDMDICWLNNRTLLSCDTARAEELDYLGQYRRFFSPGQVTAVLEVPVGFFQEADYGKKLYSSRLFSLF